MSLTEGRQEQRATLSELVLTFCLQKTKQLM